jgi:hypothetical protein
MGPDNAVKRISLPALMLHIPGVYHRSRCSLPRRIPVYRFHRSGGSVVAALRGLWANHHLPLRNS